MRRSFSSESARRQTDPIMKKIAVAPLYSLRPTPYLFQVISCRRTKPSKLSNSSFEHRNCCAPTSEKLEIAEFPSQTGCKIFKSLRSNAKSRHRPLKTPHRRYLSLSPARLMCATAGPLLPLPKHSASGTHTGHPPMEHFHRQNPARTFFRMRIIPKIVASGWQLATPCGL